VTQFEETGCLAQLGDAIGTEQVGCPTQMRTTGHIFGADSADRPKVFAGAHESKKNRLLPAEMLFSGDSRNNSSGVSV
jgi:hypothetical protein